MFTLQYVFGLEKKKDGVQRIIIVGDSITAGHTSASYSYPIQLTQMLNDPGRYEVISFGLPAAGIMKTGRRPY